jgi:nicotinamidase-related amidase
VEDMKKINFIAIGIILISALIVSAAVAAEVKKIDLGKPALLVIDPGMPDVPKRGFIYGAKVKFGDFFIEHTWGAKPFAGLEPGEGQLEVIKKRFNSFHNTNLKPLLDALGVDTLIITGVSCHACVNGTIVGANDWDYKFIVLYDAIAGPSEGMCNFLFTKLWPSWGVKVVTILEALGK